MRRGDIRWAELQPPIGSDPGFRRPVLVVQSEDFNRSRIRTVIALAITTSLNLAASPGNVRRSRHRAGLPKGSVVDVSQIITPDRRFLSERVGRVSHIVLAQIEAGLQLVLGLRT